jgi:UDP-N-acetylmuramoyl-L-alanyl-D-glutamate--2,6-diaminopimelate ligase
LLFKEISSIVNSNIVDESQITGLAIDSRLVKPGNIFFALPGTKIAGISFAKEAIEAGANLVISDTDSNQILEDKLVIVKDLYKVYLQIVDKYFDYPTKNMKLIGISGTNGKTSTTFLVQSILKAANINCGVIGTTGYWINDNKTVLSHTTPDPISLAEIFQKMKTANVEAVAMEVSSHALEQHRVDNLEFTCGVFTNLTRDHIDYHITFDAYRDAKAKLYHDLLKDDGWIISNIDDVMGQWMIEHAKTKNVITYGSSYKADLRIADADFDSKGSWLKIESKWGKFQVHLNLAGRFNLYNATAAFGVGLGLNINPIYIIKGIETLKGIPGRFERIDMGQDFEVIVDYAHTPDALENVLKSAKEVCRGRLIAVFGCGGDRDKGKRPLMGKIASEIADYTIITSDNPRTENPENIIEEIEQGLSGQSKSYAIQSDRKKAIRIALTKARTDDFVVIAGKGHEDYQILGITKIHFSDREEIIAWLKEQGYNEAQST